MFKTFSVLILKMTTQSQPKEGDKISHFIGVQGNAPCLWKIRKGSGYKEST